MAEEIFLPLSFDTSGLTSELDSMQSSIKNLSEESQKFGTEGSQAARNVGKSMDDGKKSTEKATESTKSATAAQTLHNNSILKSIANYKVFGVSIAGVSAKLVAARSALIGMTAATKGGSVALKVFRAALISTGIGAIVVVLGSAIAALTRFQSAIDAVSVVMRVMGRLLDVVMDRLAGLGSGLLKIMRGKFSEGFDEISDSVSGLTDEIVEQTEKAVLLERQLQRLTRAENDFVLRKSQLNKIISEGRQALRDESIALEEREKILGRVKKAVQDMTEEERALKTARVAQLLDMTDLQEAERVIQKVREEGTIALNEVGDFESREEDRAEVLQNIADIVNLETAAANQLRTLSQDEDRINNQMLKTQREVAKERENARKEQIQAEKDYADALQKVQEKIEQNRIGALSGSERVKAERDKALKEIDALETELQAQAKAAGKAYDESFVEALRGQVRREAEEELTEITRQANAERIESFFNMVQKRISERKKEISQQEELALLEVELLEESTNELLNLEQFKEKRRLEIKKESYFQQLELIRAQFGPESEEAKLLETQILILNKKIAGILDVDKSEEFQTIQDKFNAFLKDTLSLDEDQLGEFKDAIASIASDIGGLITETTNRQIEENERLLDSLSEQRREVEGEIKAELEAKEKGYANNVESKRKELEQIAAQEQAAEQRAEELRQKSLKRELAANTAEQAVSLGTAAANLIKGFSSIPLGLGIPLALALVAKVFTTFKSLKAQAAEIGSSSLSEGGAVSQHLNGRSDKGGQRGHRVEGSNLRLGGDEYVIRSEISQRERPFIEAFNKDGWKSVPPSLLPDSLGGRVVGTGVNANDMLVRDAIRKQTEDMIKHSDGKEEIIPLPNGYMRKKGSKIKRVVVKE